MIANVRRRAASEITCWDMTCQPTEMASHPTSTIDRDRLDAVAACRAGRISSGSIRVRPHWLPRVRAHLVAGVPMPWMTRWPGAFPIHVAEASGVTTSSTSTASSTSTSASATPVRWRGTVSAAVADAIAHQASIGLTTMLPSADAAWVGAELARRFRTAQVAAGDDRHRCQPVRPAIRPPPHRAAEDRGDGLVLPRHGRRDAGDPRRRPPPRRQSPGRDRSPRRPGADHPGRAVQRPRRARAGAGPWRRGRAC